MEEGHLLSSIAHSTEDYIRLWRHFATGNRVDGIVLVAPTVELYEHQVDPELIPSALCLSRPTRNRKGWDAVDSVTLDNREAMERLLQHVYQLGARTLLHPAGLMDNVDARERKKAFIQFVRQYDDVTGEVLPGGPTRSGGRESVLNYLEERSHPVPDAILCFNDSTAFGALEALRKTTREKTEHVLVTGFDGEPAADLLGLTTIHAPATEIGRESARLLYRRMGADDHARPQHRTVGTELLIRNSTTQPGTCLPR
jgi:LacI family transcriptional regulator